MAGQEERDLKLPMHAPGGAGVRPESTFVEAAEVLERGAVSSLPEAQSWSTFWFQRVLWTTTAIGILYTALGLVAVLVTTRAVGFDKLFVMLGFGLCASIVWRRQPQFAAVLAVIGGAYAEPFLASVGPVPLNLVGAVPLVLWAIAADHLPRTAIFGSAASAALWIANGSTGLIYSLLLLAALVPLLLHAKRERLAHLGWFIVFLLPGAFLVFLAAIGRYPESVLPEFLGNCLLGFSPMWCLARQQLPKRETENERKQLSPMDP